MTKFIILIALCIIINMDYYKYDNFILSSIDEAEVLSIQSNKPMLLIFGSKQCKFCDQLYEDIISKKINTEKFIVCYIDIERYPNMKTKHSITSIPDSRIVNHDTVKSKMIGYNKEKYSHWLTNEN